ncbi:capsular polysaccharide synthesis protein [Bacteroides fragilis]
MEKIIYNTLSTKICYIKMNTLTIPKTIHYCWFGKNDLPPLVKKCIKSWHKYLPDYEFKLWDEQSFDITSNKWCQEAYKQKKVCICS